MGNSFLYHFKRLFSPALKDKIKLLFLILKYDWRIVPAEFPRNSPFAGISDEEAKERFPGLDPDSLEVCRLYLRRNNLPPDRYMLQLCNRDVYCPVGARRLEKPISLEVLKVTREKHFPPSYGDVSTLYFHNGLKLLSPSALEYIRDTVFIDGGAYCGDSAIMFMRYSPKKVLSFEPSPANRELYEKMMKINKVPEEKFLLLPLGLSSGKETLRFQDHADNANTLQKEGDTIVETVDLDSFLAERDFGRIGVIKADLEGMGLKMLLGAEKVIRKHRPVLALSIYHNPEEFFGMYSTLKQWDLNYGFRIVSLEPVTHGEITLIGIPSEAEEKKK